jgi:mycothiol synthase
MLPDPRLHLRRPTLDDVQRILDLINAADLHDYGEVDMTAEDVRAEFVGTDPRRDAWLVEDDERAVGLAAIHRRAGVKLIGTVYVHPDDRRQGIGTTLVGLLEQRAAELVPLAPAGARVTLDGWVNAESDEALNWARQLGYERARSFWRMQIEMTAPPPRPNWPEGISVRSFRRGDERRVFDTVEEAFADHWGHVPMQYEEWLPRTQRDDFDPSLWFLAFDRDELVATSLCSLMPDDRGWVNSLGVRRQWRNRGLARAILLHSFAVFWRRGRATVALGVDADSLTGATRLYEAVGMHVRERHDQVSKVLRDGTDTAVRSLER